MEAGTALFGVDFRDDLGPIEAGMEKAVSFTKGCYIGQEVIAKMHYRGKPPKRITGLGIEGETVPEPGATVFAGGEVAGRITSAAAGPSIGRTIALAVVRTRHLETGSALHLDLGGREVAATPEEPPFR